MTGAIVAGANLVSPRLLPLGFAPDILHMNNGINNIMQFVDLDAIHMHGTYLTQFF